MNEELNKFKKKKCGFCGEYYYEDSLYFQKYNIIICNKCKLNKKSNTLDKIVYNTIKFNLNKKEK